MSRLGRKPVPIPDGVKVAVNGNAVKAEGPKGSLEYKLPANVKVKIDEAKKLLSVETTYVIPQDNINHGTIRSHINNMLIGVHQGYEEKMEIIGTGYKAVMDGKNLAISLGFSHPVKVDVPAGIAVTIPNPNLLVIQGINKQITGAFAAKIKAIKPSEPYNLKGIKYVDEVIKRKTGKTFVSGTA
ncbi:MAG: 50S ribosomal protein L6 [Planctomycetota bacterium]